MKKQKNSGQTAIPQNLEQTSPLPTSIPFACLHKIFLPTPKNRYENKNRKNNYKKNDFLFSC